MVAKGDVTVGPYYLTNFLYSQSFMERLADAYTISVRSTKLDGKDCYILSSLMFRNIMYEIGTTDVKVYIEKAKGAILKVVQKVNTNNQSVEKLATYEYKIGTVTTKMLKNQIIHFMN